jgi:hypothetical protein
MVHHSVLFNINGAALVPNFQFGFSLMSSPWRRRFFWSVVTRSGWLTPWSSGSSSWTADFSPQILLLSPCMYVQIYMSLCGRCARENHWWKWLITLPASESLSSVCASADQNHWQETLDVHPASESLSSVSADQNHWWEPLNMDPVCEHSPVFPQFHNCHQIWTTKICLYFTQSVIYFQWF